MRLLVTRAEPEAGDLARRLTALGHQVLVQPLMTIIPAPEPSNLQRPAAIIVTSGNGARALASWRAAKAWRTVPAYAVGSATGDALREAGFTDIRVAHGDAVALAAFIRGDFDPQQGALLYAAARDQSADLAALLPGLEVITVEAYRAEAAAMLDPAIARALAAGTVDGVLFFSRRTAEIFRDLAIRAGVAGGLGGTTFYTLSLQVAEPLAALGAAGVRVAAHPDQPSLLALLDPALARPA
jgi:uroporphyrinogen-III synthase